MFPLFPSSRALLRALGILIPVTLASSPVLGATGIFGEAVDDYKEGTMDECSGNLSHNIENVSGFFDTMTTSGGVSWPQGNFYQDNDVWDSDVVDSDLDGNGDDLYTFDDGGSSIAISMFSGHGVGYDWDYLHNCTQTSDCTHPITALGQSTPGYCLKGPPDTQGVCVYYKPRTPVTCSSNDAFSHRPELTYLSAFGESSNSGSWNGAGTNGGINFAIMDISFGIRPGNEAAELWWVFAGLHNYATIMPTTYLSDTSDSPDRGAAFGVEWQWNSSSSISLSWLDAMNNLSTTDGFKCDLDDSTGYAGILGCGAYWVGSVAQSQSQAEWLNGTESWIQARSDSNDATGASYMAWVYSCNYDCNTNPIIL